MGVTTGQQLRAIADGIEQTEEEARNLECLVMEVASEHNSSCPCKVCAWASRYPGWLARLRCERAGK